MQELTVETIRKAIKSLQAAQIRPRDFIAVVKPRLSWWVDNHDPEDKGGWIVEFGPGSVMHPYAYVDIAGEDDPLSQEIIAKTDYRNRKNG
jgi:hypothetical protein